VAGDTGVVDTTGRSTIYRCIQPTKSAMPSCTRAFSLINHVKMYLLNFGALSER
jgi:hypothetical protein